MKGKIREAREGGKRKATGWEREERDIIVDRMASLSPHVLMLRRFSKLAFKTD